MSSDSSNDNGERRIPDAHGQAALLLVESLIHGLIARKVIGDFRAPDLMRFGFAPLYVSLDEAVAAASHVEAVMAGREWERPEYKVRSAVT